MQRSGRHSWPSWLVVGIVAAACTAVPADGTSTSAATEPLTAAPTTVPAPPPTPAATTTLPSTVAPPPAVDRSGELARLLDEWATERDPVGVVAAVQFPDGERWRGSAGLANRDSGAPVEVTDRFEIASITKTFMAVLALRLAEEGLVDLDDPVALHLPEFPSADAMTLRHLLGHRAGVYDPTPELVSDRDGPPDPTVVFAPDALLDAAAAGTPVFAPGSRHDYSNAGYWVVAAALERATGRAARTLLGEYVLEPLSLADTLLFDATLPATEVVNAYADLDLDGQADPMGTAPLPGFVTAAWTAGGMVSTADDLVTFLDGVFAGRLISDASLEELVDTSSGGGGYALGIYRSGSMWGHDGGIVGYLSAAFHDPTSGITVAVLTNRFGPDAPQADALARRIASRALELVDS